MRLEMEEYLAWQKGMCKDGYFHPEYLVVPTVEDTQVWYAGVSGCFYAYFGETGTAAPDVRLLAVAPPRPSEASLLD